MSAALSGIGPVSVRYAAQIRDLLYAQAVRRMAADAEAARADAEAERTARAEAIARPHQAEEPVKVDVKVETTKLAEPVKQPEAKDAEPAPVPAPTQVPVAQLIDELA